MFCCRLACHDTLEVPQYHRVGRGVVTLPPSRGGGSHGPATLHHIFLFIIVRLGLLSWCPNRPLAWTTLPRCEKDVNVISVCTVAHPSASLTLSELPPNPKSQEVLEDNFHLICKNLFWGCSARSQDNRKQQRRLVTYLPTELPLELHPHLHHIGRSMKPSERQLTSNEQTRQTWQETRMALLLTWLLFDVCNMFVLFVYLLVNCQKTIKASLGNPWNILKASNLSFPLLTCLIEQVPNTPQPRYLEHSGVSWYISKALDLNLLDWRRLHSSPYSQGHRAPCGCSRAGWGDQSGGVEGNKTEGSGRCLRSKRFCCCFLWCFFYFGVFSAWCFYFVFSLGGFWFAKPLLEMCVCVCWPCVLARTLFRSIHTFFVDDVRSVANS